MPYETFAYDLISYLHSFRTLHLRHRVVVGDRHLDVADHLLVQVHLVCLIYKEKTMVRHLYVVEILNQLMDHLMQDVVHLDVLQILDEQNLVANRPFLVVVLQSPVVAVVDAELRHLLKMDCYLDEVDEELRHLLKMDCYLDEAQVLMELRVQHFRRRDRQPHALQLPLYLQSILLAPV
jgi:hypothetical protein